MKAVMYHYVRSGAPGLPHFPFLHVADFERQLDYFSAEYGIASREEFLRWRDGGPAPRGALLTFDDGLVDHLEFVLPVLRARGLFGLFYAPSGPALNDELLDVHKVHLALGKLGGPAALQWLDAHVPEALPPVHERDDIPRYTDQNSDLATKFIKYRFNWQLSAADRRRGLDGLLNHAFNGAPPGWRNFYLDETGLRALAEAGMGVGPHGHEHEVLANLPPDLQSREVVASCDYIERAGGSRSWGYCYAYGSANSITQQAKTAVAEAGCPFAFSSAPGDIDTPLADAPRYALPRHNCNTYPYGSVSFDRPG